MLSIKRLNFLQLRQLSTIKMKVAVGQMTATNDIKHNLNQVNEIIENGKKENAQMIFLPEACDFLGENKEQTLQLAEPLTGFVVSQYKKLARKHNIWLSFGGVHEKTDNNKIYNSHIVINNSGSIVATYRKLHLFDVKIPEEKIFLVESKVVKPGEQIIPPIQTPVGNLGLAICYDMRFPELAIALRQKDADILTYPSAFTYATGLAHWEVLLRARAIESQCYVIAAAQIGAHNKKRSSYGQSLVIDPWGQIVAECPKHDGKKEKYDATSICFADIDFEKIRNVRRKMPVLEHKRIDIYGDLAAHSVFQAQKENQSFYNFGGKQIPKNTVFYKTSSSFAFTNIRCVVQGHVLVATLREAKRLSDLNSREVSDLFNCVAKVQKIVEKAYSATSSTIAIQDGEDAGQSVKHVHVHILPRIKGDFLNNDDIYMQLAKHDKQQANSNNPIRKVEEQIAEAEMLMKINI